MPLILTRAVQGILLLVGLVGLVLVAWYQIDGQPLPQTRTFLESTSFVARELPSGGWDFVPATPNGKGVLILHGALIKPQAYVATAAFFAREGYYVFIPAGDFRLSLPAAGRIADGLSSSSIAEWFVIGHSMGGMTALEVATQTSKPITGIAIWAGAMLEDFSEFPVPLLFLHGDRDGLLPKDRLAQTRALLPPTTRFRLIEGANHRNFAMYSHQFFDDQAQVDPEVQREMAQQWTLEFFRELGGDSVTSIPATTTTNP